MAFVDEFAKAIAYAEGFYVSGSRAARNNNPGDLTEDTIGLSVGRDGPFVVYATIADGWAALKKQIEMMLDGSSAFYDPAMSLLQIAQRYTATDPVAWANNVAGRLNVSVDTTLGELTTLLGGLPPLTTAFAAIVVLGVLWALRKGF